MQKILILFRLISKNSISSMESKSNNNLLLLIITIIAIVVKTSLIYFKLLNFKKQYFQIIFDTVLGSTFAARKITLQTEVSQI